MKNSEVIAMLSKFDPDLYVSVYGKINPEDIAGYFHANIEAFEDDGNGGLDIHLEALVCGLPVNGE